MKMLMKAATVLLLFAASAIVSGNIGYRWGYGKADGPHTWRDRCIHGARQSPIDFKASNLQIVNLPRIDFFFYKKPGTVNVTHDDKSIRVDGFSDWGEYQPYITGGGLAKYKLAQFHFHWAQNQLNGSEHAVGSLQYPAELHLVHLKDGYTMEEAVKHPDGIAVLGVFLAVENDGRALSNLDSFLRDLDETRMHTRAQNFILNALLPTNTEAFYRYEGSLTTPGCDEAVIWTILADPVSITQDQLESFRRLRNSAEIEHNARPMQALNRRFIKFRPSTALNSFILNTPNIKDIISSPFL